ncbi:MAG: hypothetical protein R3A52_27260 [Polyangiales bacterium]
MKTKRGTRATYRGDTMRREKRDALNREAERVFAEMFPEAYLREKARRAVEGEE